MARRSLYPSRLLLEFLLLARARATLFITKSIHRNDTCHVDKDNENSNISPDDLIGHDSESQPQLYHPLISPLSNGIIKAVYCDLAHALLPRFRLGQLTLLVFNPPSVPTPGAKMIV